MLTEIEQKLAWEGWFSGEVRSNYFADLAGRYRRRQSIGTWSTLLLSSGALGALISSAWPDWVAKVLATLTTGVSLWTLVAKNQQHAQDATELHHRWNRLAADYRRLWEEADHEDASSRLSSLEERAAQLSVDGTEFPANRRLIAKWHRHVEEHFRYYVPLPVA